VGKAKFVLVGDPDAYHQHYVLTESLEEMVKYLEEYVGDDDDYKLFEIKRELQWECTSIHRRGKSPLRKVKIKP